MSLTKLSLAGNNFFYSVYQRRSKRSVRHVVFALTISLKLTLEGPMDHHTGLLKRWAELPVIEWLNKVLFCFWQILSVNEACTKPVWLSAGEWTLCYHWIIIYQWMKPVLSLCDYLLGNEHCAGVELLSTTEWTLYWACVIICWAMNTVLALNYYLPVN